MSAAVTIEESCERVPADSAVADCERLASTVKPPNSPVERFAAPRATSSWSASISYLCRAAKARPAPSDSPTARKTMPAAPAARNGRSRSEMLGSPGIGIPVWISPTTLTSWTSRSKASTAMMPSTRATSGPGIFREIAPQHEDEGQGAGPDREGPRVGVGQVVDQDLDLLDRAVTAAGHAEELRQLADDDRDRQAEDEPGDDGLGEEVGDEAEANDPGRQEDRPDHQREARGQREVAVRVAARERADDRGGHDRHRRARRDLEMAARAEDRVGGEGGERRDQPVLGRHAREGRVGHGHGHHDAPRGEGRRPGRPAASRRDRRAAR